MRYNRGIFAGLLALLRPRDDRHWAPRLMYGCISCVVLFLWTSVTPEFPNRIHTRTQNTAAGRMFVRSVTDWAQAMLGRRCWDDDGDGERIVANR